MLDICRLLYYHYFIYYQSSITHNPPSLQNPGLLKWIRFGDNETHIHTHTHTQRSSFLKTSLLLRPLLQSSGKSFCSLKSCINSTPSLCLLIILEWPETRRLRLYREKKTTNQNNKTKPHQKPKGTTTRGAHQQPT